MFPFFCSSKHRAQDRPHPVRLGGGVFRILKSIAEMSAGPTSFTGSLPKAGMMCFLIRRVASACQLGLLCHLDVVIDVARARSSTVKAACFAAAAARRSSALTWLGSIPALIFTQAASSRFLASSGVMEGKTPKV